MTNDEHKMLEELLIEYQRQGDTPQDLLTMYNVYLTQPKFIQPDYFDVFPNALWKRVDTTITADKLIEMLQFYDINYPIAINNLPVKEVHLRSQDETIYVNVRTEDV